MNWIQIYRGYDDETLATLSNPGLVRRALKDVENGKLQWQQKNAEGCCIVADDQEVHLDKRGIPGASCNCPAPGICKHILSAAIWLRCQIDEPFVEQITQADLDVLAELLALDLVREFKSAGIASVRKASSLLTGLSQPANLTHHSTNLQIQLPDLNFSVRYLAGGGLAGMVSDAPEKTAIAFHLAAIACVWRDQQQQIPWPKGIEQETPINSEINSGVAENQFINQVEALVLELLNLGLAHISAISAQRLLALSLSARAEGIPRLASLLRNLSGLIRNLAEREVTVNSQDLLAQLAHIYAWCQASRHAQGNELAKLFGLNKRRFEQQSNQLELLPLGAWWWQTQGGARGLSLALWEPVTGEILQAVQARPNELDPNFSQQQAWATQVLWRGAGSVENICKSCLRLEKPRIADDGRLALAGETQASLIDNWNIDDQRLNSLGIQDWSELHQQLLQTQGLTADRIDCLFLRPTRISSLQLDEINQVSAVHLYDIQNRTLTLTLACDESSLRATKLFEHLLRDNNLPFGILVNVLNSSSGFRFKPVAVMVERNRQIHPVVLDFAPLPAQPPTSFANRMLKFLRTAKTQNLPLITSPSLTLRLTAPVTSLLETLAVTGRFAINSNQRQMLLRQSQQITACGIDYLHQSLDTLTKCDAVKPEEILQLYYLIDRLGNLHKVASIQTN